MAATLLETGKGSIIFGSMRMEPDPRAGWMEQKDASLRFNLKVGAQLSISPDGRTLYLQTSIPAVSVGGALTRAIDEAQLQQIAARQPKASIPILSVTRLGELKPLGGVGWILGPSGWELPFERPIGQTPTVLALFVGYEATRRLEVREYSWCPTAMETVLNPPQKKQVCPNCGQPRREGAKFCGSCGTKF